MTGVLMRDLGTDMCTHRGKTMCRHREKTAIDKPTGEAQKKPVLLTNTLILDF
jgi:hypothetical protein